MATLTDGFELASEKQVTLIIRGTFDSAINSSLQIYLETVSSGSKLLVSKAEISKNFAGESFASFTLRLSPGKYRWKAQFSSVDPSDIINPDLFREYFLIHDDLSGGLPFGTLGSIRASATNNSFFMFSGISGRKITVGAKANSTAALSGILTLENMTTGLAINSPRVLNNFGNSEIWTQISYFNIDQNNIYKAAFTTSSTDLNSLNSFMSLYDSTG